MSKEIKELQRIRSILSYVTGFEDDDQENIEDARKSVGRVIDSLAEQPAPVAKPHEQEPVACECHRCIDEKGLKVNSLPLSMTKMILCPKCGNKRCPKASDHRLTCTNSNDPGQPGSIYTSPPAQRTWVGLTDEEKRQLFDREDYQGWLDYINAIEAKLKEKNTHEDRN